MSQLSLQIPETLHRRLLQLSNGEGIPLDQYIIYALTERVSQTYVVTKNAGVSLAQTQASIAKLRDRLGTASSEEIQVILDEREIVEPEVGLSPEVIDRIQCLIQESAHQSKV
jgi:hypothetical protein